MSQRLNQIGPGFCLAKFYNLTLHLNSGHNHSCIHPRTHQVPLSEVQHNVHALHNSDYKKSVRAEMFAGQRPAECGYCWKMEDADPTVISDRIGFSFNLLDTHPELLDEVKSNGANYDYKPRQLEVSFSSLCNFKCVYCSPEFSSRWFEDVAKGDAPNIGVWQEHNLKNLESRNRIPIKNNNPYVDAFWQWFPQVYDQLSWLKLTGGEPLLHDDTFRLLDWIKSQKNVKLKVGINSNLGVPEKVISKFITALNDISDQVKSITVWVSGEASGSQFDYIRLGGNHSEWIANLHRVLGQVPAAQVNIMTTYSALSVPGYQTFLNDMGVFLQQYPKRFSIDTHTYLQYPKYLQVDILTPDFVPYIQQQIQTLETYYQQQLIPEYQIGFARRVLMLLEHSLNNPAPDINNKRSMFCQYIKEFDRRNNLDFKTTFPEMVEFYEKFSN